MRILGTLVLALAIPACASSGARIDMPATLIGTIESPRFTGWFVDYCNGRVLVKSAPDCAQLGGEVYRAILRAESPQGAAPVPALVIAFPAHALLPSYRARKRVNLVSAPPAFAEATGISYVAVDWDDP